MYLVDKPCLNVLPDGGHTAAKPDFLILGSFRGPLKCGVDAIRDEVEGGTPTHNDRFARVVGQHKDGCMVRRIVAPPPLPFIVWPFPSNRPKHVTAQDPRTDVAEPASREFVILAGGTAVPSMYLPKRSSSESPFVQCHAADSKRIVEVLVRAGAKAVDGYGEALNTEFCHGRSAKFGIPANPIRRIKPRSSAPEVIILPERFFLNIVTRHDPPVMEFQAIKVSAATVSCALLCARGAALVLLLNHSGFRE
jgi:hypothetical protein